jgi:hypothetical protein
MMATITADDFAPDLPDRVMKKAQWRLIPLLFLAYLIAIIDRLNISFAAAKIVKVQGSFRQLEVPVPRLLLEEIDVEPLATR